MKKAIKIFVLFISILALSSCGGGGKIHNGQTHDEYTMGTMRAYVYNYTSWQVDSMCVADGLPRNLSDWANSSYNDFETGKRIVKKVYIKEFSEKREMIYIISQMDEEYWKIIKRYVEAE